MKTHPIVRTLTLVSIMLTSLTQTACSDAEFATGSSMETNAIPAAVKNASAPTYIPPETTPKQPTTQYSANKDKLHTPTARQTETIPAPETTRPVTEPAPTEPPIVTVPVNNLQASTISVSCLKVTWEPEQNREYEVSVDTNAPYLENMYFHFKEKGILYLTGLRENSEYKITVSAITGENEQAVPATTTGHTEKVVVIYNFDEDADAYAQYKDSGVLYSTNFFAGERASGLTAQPASGAIAGSIKDPIYDTTIRVDEYGDFCVAMGTFFGHDWDRYLITLQNGQQFTVKQCDDKGAKWYHPIGGNDNNRNIIEFIYDSDANVPPGVWAAGTWGAFFWNGLAFDHIASIQKINYPDNPVTY